MQIQNASPRHFDRILEIYAHHVMRGYATFDERPPTMDERLPWFEQFSAEGLHQLLVAVDGEDVLGYAASMAYRSHPAFALRGPLSSASISPRRAPAEASEPPSIATSSSGSARPEH